MRITSQISYDNLIRDINQIQERMQASQNEISSGKSVTKPSDDPFAASDIVRINSQSAENNQYLSNLGAGRTRLQYTDNVLDGVEQMIDRVRTLGLQSLGNISSAQAYTTEITGLREQIVSAANTTYQGRFIFGGSATDAPPYVVQTGGTVTYQGNSDDVRVQINQNSTLQVQIPGNEVFTGSVDIFATMDRLTTAINAGDKSGVNAEVLNLERFAQVLSTSRSRIGGNVNIADAAERDLKSYGLAQDADLQRLQSADLSKAISDFTQNQNALNAATALGGKISNLSILDYL